MLVAVQDEASRYGTVALSELKRLGAKEPIVLDYRGSFAMAGFAGSNLPSWVNQAQNKRGEGPSTLTATIEICNYPGKYQLLKFCLENLFIVNPYNISLITVY